MKFAMSRSMSIRVSCADERADAPRSATGSHARRRYRMKKCRRCTKPATLHITEIRERRSAGAAPVRELCEGVSEQRSVGSPTDEPTVVRPAASRSEEPRPRLRGAGSPRLPAVRHHVQQFRSQGRLGCPHDYVAFREELMPLIENIHGDAARRQGARNGSRRSASSSTICSSFATT